MTCIYFNLTSKIFTITISLSVYLLSRVPAAPNEIFLISTITIKIVALVHRSTTKLTNVQLCLQNGTSHLTVKGNYLIATRISYFRLSTVVEKINGTLLQWTDVRIRKSEIPKQLVKLVVTYFLYFRAISIQLLVLSII